MRSDNDKVIVTVSAHHLDSYRSVEQRARRRWLQALAERGEYWRDAGLHLVDSQPDEDLDEHLTYRFEGTTISCAPETGRGFQSPA